MKTWIFTAVIFAVLQGECANVNNHVGNVANNDSDSRRFPTRSEAYVRLRDIDIKFVAAEPGRDNWKDFIPLLEQVVEFQPTVSNRQEMLNVEFEIVEWMTILAFACEYDFDEIKANFDSRIACLDLECKVEYVRSDTNGVMMIADWLGGAQPIVVDEETNTRRSSEMASIDRLMIYGGKTRPRRHPGSFSYCGPFASPYCRSPYLIRELKAQHFRRRYNERLPEFRRKAEARMRRFVFEEFKAKDQAEREALWAEFCRRAKFAAKH